MKTIKLYLALAENVATNLGDKERARKIYKEVEGSVDEETLEFNCSQTYE